MSEALGGTNPSPPPRDGMGNAIRSETVVASVVMPLTSRRRGVRFLRGFDEQMT